LSVKLDYENAELTFNHVSSNYASDGLKIKSPISGYVSKVYVEAGQYVETGQPLMKVSKNIKLVMRADLPQRYYEQIPNITSASFKTTYCTTPHDIKDLNGRLISYGKYTDGSSYYTPIFFELDSRSHIIPGAYVEIFLHSTPIDNAIVVPKEAIMEEQGLHYVFVKLSDTHYERRFVEVAGGDGIKARIASGLDFGDIVVGKGANNIKLASKASGAVPHSHSH
jgi:RND family efflux transporter MFP subunit